jgi:hypothetical protein
MLKKNKNKNTTHPQPQTQVRISFKPPVLPTRVFATLSISSGLVRSPSHVFLLGDVVSSPLLQVDRGVMAWTGGGVGSKLLKLRNSGKDRFKIRAEIQGGDEDKFEIIGEPSKNLRPGKVRYWTTLGRLEGSRK